LRRRNRPQPPRRPPRRSALSLSSKPNQGSQVTLHRGAVSSYKEVGKPPSKHAEHLDLIPYSLFSYSSFSCSFILNVSLSSLYHFPGPSQRLPATYRARRRCPCRLSSLLTRPCAVCSHISSYHIMSTPAETETKPVEPVAPIVEGSSLIPAETAPAAEEYKKEVRVVPLHQSLCPLTRASALSGGPQASCEFHL
jgi:hypothetical protein